MGSFIVRLAAEKYVTPEKLIVMGTGGSNPAAGAGIALIGAIKLFKGEKHISKFVDSIAFGGYNKRFEDELSVAPSPWLTTDTEVRKKYAADKYCTFKFTVSAMGDLMRLLKLSNRKAWYRNLPRIPVLLVSGEEDPVGNYGRGVCEVEDNLKKYGHSVTKILYSGARHEILNDFTYESVKRDILTFLSLDGVVV
jgi:alpha-beta hydrolase superfamily lysophospholipase